MTSRMTLDEARELAATARRRVGEMAGTLYTLYGWGTSEEIDRAKRRLESAQRTMQTAERRVARMEKKVAAVKPDGDTINDEQD